jgi:ABC-type lipoprotein release transport system permease subunit
VFLAQALVVGLVGVALGCAAGWELARWFQAHPIFQGGGFTVRPLLSAGCFVWPSLVALGATLGAGLYPSLRAARTDAGRVLRSIE